MNNFRGIRYAQSKLMDILTTKGYREGTLAASTQATLDDLIAFCAAYEKHRWDIENLMAKIEDDEELT